MPDRFDFFGRGFQHHGGHHVAVVRVVGQRIVNHIFGLFRVRRQGDEFFRATVNLAPLEIHDALAQRFVGGRLLHRRQRRVDIQAAGVGVVPVLAVDQLANSLGHVLCMHPPVVLAFAYFELLFFGRNRLLCGDEFVFLHALNDVELAGAGSLRVADRVEGRRGFGQAGQHRGFGNGDFLQGFAEIGFRGGGKSVSTVTQKNLVHVDLKDLVFGEQVFELEGQQNFINFAHVAFFGRQIHIACHLHGDGRCALAFGTPHIGQAGAHHAQIVHAAVLEKARVFDGQHRVFHHLRNVFDGRQTAPLFAELADQRPIC